MALKIGIPVTTTGVAYTLADGDTFWNFAGDTVISTANDAVLVTGSNNTLTIGGHIYGSDSALEIGDAGTDTGNTINVLAGGVLGGTSNDGLHLIASGTTVNNAGTIAANDDGIVASGSTGTTTINNSGLITVFFWGVNHTNTGDALLTNTGTIRSSNHESYDGNSAVDKIINSGLMVGSVDLSSGADIYDGRGGRVIANVIGGDVDGEAGNDTLIGGKFVDTFIGGADNDFLTGGLGIDLLSGGLGLDRFIFNAVTERGDIISDFAAVDDTIAVKSSAFGGLAKGVLAAAAFHSSATGLAHDASDRFIYETDVDRLWYDSNGNAAGGRVLLADLNDTTFTRADILVI